MTRLLPDLNELSAATTDNKNPILLYFLRLSDADSGERDIESLFQSYDARCLHWWNCEYTFIGEGPNYWTHAAVFQFKSQLELNAAAKAGLASDAVLDLQLFAAKNAMPPAILRALFRAIRPVGFLFAGLTRMLTPDFILANFKPGSVISPNREQLERHLANHRKSKAYMVNLLEYKERAEYSEPVRRPDVSGMHAYTKRYGLAAMRSVALVGGRLVFAGELGAPLIESKDAPAATRGSWNALAVVQYPDPSRLFHLEVMPGYRKSLIHRRASLKRTTLIVSK